jgi:transposase
MTPEEAQQAQTIAQIASRHKYQDSVRRTKLAHETGIFDMCHRDRELLLEIVDSQAQKIKEQAKEIERLQYKSKALELRCQHGV